MQELDELRRLNFDKLLILKHPDVKNYSFSEYRENNYRHPEIIGYCTECEEKGYNKSVRDADFSLRHISHGAHSQDFFDALKETVDVTGWHEESVLFVYETPSLDDENRRMFRPVELSSGVTKYPTREWYWVHHDRDAERFPDGFKGKAYSEFFLSVILTFRLRNAYMTNLVKCGLNSADGKKFSGLADFNTNCVQTCIAQYLRREIEILRPRVIFAMGAGVYEWVVSAVAGAYPTCQLPHPAGGRRGFKDTYFRVVYFWLVLLALRDAGVIQTAEAEELARLFIQHSPETCR